ITDTVQAVLLLLGAALLTFFGLQALGDIGITNWAELKEAAKPDQLSMIQSIGDPEATGRLGLREYSWYSILFGYPVLGIWYWCTDQTIVQKILSAKTEKDGRDGAIFAGFLKILPVFLMVLPGVIGYVLFKDKIGDDNDSTLMIMMTELLPVGVRGLMAAGLLAALMSTIAAALNSVATLTAEDIFKRLRPEAADHELVKVGRITAAVVIVLAMLWSSQGAKFGSIFEAINKIPMAFAPGITTIFLFGVFWKRGNRQGAMAALLFNVAVGLVYLCIDIPLVGTTQWINQELGIPFMQVGWYLFLLSSVIYVTVSLLTPAPAPEKTEGLCWNRPLDALRGPLVGTVTDPRVMAGILVMIMVVLYSLLH
ncbi:MAG TPA: sodium/solute symporter, partial [Opitutales bacterium]|nr:sodium/solute symporter [Opitutales bacterium]